MGGLPPPLTPPHPSPHPTQHLMRPMGATRLALWKSLGSHHPSPSPHTPKVYEAHGPKSLGSHHPSHPRPAPHLKSMRPMGPTRLALRKSLGSGMLRSISTSSTSFTRLSSYLHNKSEGGRGGSRCVCVRGEGEARCPHICVA